MTESNFIENCIIEIKNIIKERKIKFPKMGYSTSNDKNTWWSKGINSQLWIKETIDPLKYNTGDLINMINGGFFLHGRIYKKFTQNPNNNANN